MLVPVVCPQIYGGNEDHGVTKHLTAITLLTATTLTTATTLATAITLLTVTTPTTATTLTPPPMWSMSWPVIW